MSQNIGPRTKYKISFLKFLALKSRNLKSLEVALVVFSPNWRPWTYIMGNGGLKLTATFGGCSAHGVLEGTFRGHSIRLGMAKAARLLWMAGTCCTSSLSFSNANYLEVLKKP